MNTIYFLNAFKEFGENDLQIITEFPENSEFHLGVNNLWERDNTGLIT